MKVAAHKFQLYDNIRGVGCVNLRFKVIEILQKYLVHFAALKTIDTPRLRNAP